MYNTKWKSKNQCIFALPLNPHIYIFPQNVYGESSNSKTARPHGRLKYNMNNSWNLKAVIRLMLQTVKSFYKRILITFVCFRK